MSKAAIILIAFLLFIQTASFGQQRNTKANEIALYAYKLDTTTGKTDTLNFTLDSIEVKAQIQTNKIVAKCLFKQSKSILTIDLYSKERNLVFVNVKEQCPAMNDLFANTSFYYDKGQLFDEDYKCTVRPCLAYPVEKNSYEIFGYNPALTPGFPKAFVSHLYDRLKVQSSSISL